MSTWTEEHLRLLDDPDLTNGELSEKTGHSIRAITQQRYRMANGLYRGPREPQPSPVSEQVTRPDGKVWTYDPRSHGRKVMIEPTVAGPVIVVTCTHDLGKAASMASVRWGAYFPGVEQPVGVREWRRRAIQTWVGQQTVRQKAVEASTGTEARAFPVTVFYAPNLEEAATWAS